MIHVSPESCRYSDSLRVGQSGELIPVGVEIFRTRPERLWGPLSILYDGYRVSLLEVKPSRQGVNQTPPFSTEDKERVELYFITLCCVPG